MHCCARGDEPSAYIKRGHLLESGVARGVHNLPAMCRLIGSRAPSDFNLFKPVRTGKPFRTDADVKQVVTFQLQTFDFHFF